MTKARIIILKKTEEKQSKFQGQWDHVGVKSEIPPYRSVKYLLRLSSG